MPRLTATLRFLLQASAFGLAAAFLVALLRPDWADWLNRRAGPNRPVVATSPGLSTPLAFHGGVKTLGTFYWENLDGLEASDATSSTGFSIVTAQFEFGTDIARAEQRVQLFVNRLELPSTVEPQIITGSIDDLPVVQLGVTRDLSEGELAAALDVQAVPEFTDLEGVREVSVFGAVGDRVEFTVDDDALFKRPDIAEMRDLEAYPPEERAAREKGVTYVKLDGEVGILGNGAGLVMSTLDVIALAGGKPANFCDLGGGADAQGVVDALEIISVDPQVKSILFNIFAGITRCDVVAQGMLQALDQTGIAHPIVVRFDGTNAEEGRQILVDSGRENIHVEATMLDAAKRAVELAA